MFMWYMQVAREYSKLSTTRHSSTPTVAKAARQYAVKSAPVAEEETAAVQVAVAPEPLPSILDEIKPVEETANIVLLPDDNKLAEALRRTEAELRIAQNGRSAFLSAMSHELRTPLNAIMGFAEMIKNGVHGPLGNEVYQNYVQHIHDSGGELLSKVNDLLTIGSMNAHEFELDESDFLLSELLAEAIAVHSHAAFSRRLQMRLDAPSGIEVHGDRTQLLCALAHFLSNAINHSENGKEILMTARIQPDEGLILSVRDQGEGIAPQQVQHIREALQQEASYLAVQGGGIGLGLSLANELANRHGGRIMIDSIRHRGTVVSLIIPKQRILRGMPVKRRGSGVRG